MPSSEEVAELMRSYHSRLTNALASRASAMRDRLNALASRPVFTRPADALHNLAQRLDELSGRMQNSIRVVQRETQSTLTALGGKLESLSPLAVLGRGYSVTYEKTTGRLITSASRLKIGKQIETRFRSGTAVSTVDEIESDSD